MSVLEKRETNEQGWDSDREGGRLKTGQESNQNVHLVFLHSVYKSKRQPERGESQVAGNQK